LLNPTNYIKFVGFDRLISHFWTNTGQKSLPVSGMLIRKVHFK